MLNTYFYHPILGAQNLFLYFHFGVTVPQQKKYSYMKLTLPAYISQIGSTAEQQKFCFTTTKSTFTLRKTTQAQKDFCFSFKILLQSCPTYTSDVTEE